MDRDRRIRETIARWQDYSVEDDARSELASSEYAQGTWKGSSEAWASAAASLQDILETPDGAAQLREVIIREVAG